MKNIIKTLSFLYIILLNQGCETESATFNVAPVFSSHMVLQQQMEVPIWGTGTPGTLINLDASWGANTRVKVTSNGLWKTIIQTPKYGGPYELKIHALNKEISFEDVMIGEVWLTSGQSNMEWQMQNRIDNQAAEIDAANYPNIRMFSVPKNLGGSAINHAIWKVATPENVKQFSAVGYFFARELNNNLNIPIGVLNSSWGGTRVEAWMSTEKLASLEPTREEIKKIIDAGGFDSQIKKQQKENIKILAANASYLKAKNYPFPEGDDFIKLWNALELDDLAFSAPNYDDSNWDSFQVENPSKNADVEFPITFEKFYKRGTTAENGVVWYRKKFDVIDSLGAFTISFNRGIDDIDYTYVNGVLIGNTLACCTDKIYSIPSRILKKEGNVMAIRVVDTGGEGGFKGSIFLNSDNEKQRLDQGIWKQKHHAFYLYPSLQLHNLSTSELISEEEALKANLKIGLNLNDPNGYSVLFEKMLTPIMPYGIRGALWYQGESNVNNFQDYQELFSEMIRDWRSKWGYEFPFYFVQITPYIYSDSQHSYALRDAQRKSLNTPKTGMAITLDIGEEHDIHPANKLDVGLRLARLALHNDYGGKDIIPSGPLYKNHTLHSNFIEIEFDYIGSGLITKNQLIGFEIAGDNGKFMPGKAKIIGNKVRVSSSKVKTPKTIRYGWSNYFEATLFNKEGLPASSFQTN
ncbi:MAG: sialate O-acetylesterase [Flavobacteriaceae bacterium]|jgi:sialate O-acetylesterase|tara:strand:- start:3533 stop:5608 length:2076 start_codon:yes stop_codon:yes gene_type:complete